MLIFDDHTNVYNQDVDEVMYVVDMYNIDQPRNDFKKKTIIFIFSNSHTSGMFISSIK